MTALLWVDGTLRPPDTDVFQASDRGATLGDGVFDTALCGGASVVDGAAHLERLARSVAYFGYSCAPGLLEDAYALARQATAPSVLRISVSRGPGARGLAIAPTQRARVVAQLSPLPPDIRFQPVDLALAAFPRNEASPVSRHKSACYLDAIVALRQANEAGAGDALFLNTQGHVTCTTMANVFAIKGDVLFTPPVSDGVLDGICRARILALAPSLGLRLCDRSVTLDILQDADEVFATNSLRLIVPIRNFGGAKLRYRKLFAHALLAHICQETGCVLPAPDWAESVELSRG